MSVSCHHCGTALEIAEPVARDAECTSCGRDVRCCLNCRHHDPACNNACREPMADPVTDKDRRNFCEYLSLDRGASRPSDGGKRAADARARLEALFRKPGPGSGDDDV